MSSRLFRDLHRGPGLLLLPNAWDGVSARLIENLGAKAVATTSAGLAWSRGYPDGNELPQEQLIAAIGDIARVVRAPLTVDIEAGYSEDPATVARLVAHVASVGAAGINIEDGGGSAELLCRKISAIRDHLARAGADLFINTRTDVYLRGLAQGAAAIEEVIRRASRYRAAGGDGLFVPGLASAEGMTAIGAAIGTMPLNVMAVPGLPALETLEKCGVRRLSAGSSIAQAAIGRTSRLASDFLSGKISGLFDEAVNYSAVNGLFGAAVHDA
jgi:2-methylisocitrate lyase-like PEP mutase family enzyme